MDYIDKINDKLDYAIDLEVPDEVIVNRMAGRRSCVNCGAIYHVENMPSKVEGVCDRCGGELQLRDDDKPETVIKRLKVYHDETAPLIDYYKEHGIIVELDGTKKPDEVLSDILAKLGE